jgi:heat shock protein HtpX
MWERIRANQRKSLILFFLMGAVLIGLGYSIGYVWTGFPEGGIVGIFIASGIWLLLTLISYMSGDQILLTLSKAAPVTRDVHPQLLNVVEEMKIAANLPAMPKVYIIPDPAPNAFAVGIKPEKSSIAVTAGLLSMMNRDELQGVVAHETGHITNRDIQYMTFAGIALGSVVLISEVFLRSMWYSGGGRRYSSKSSGSGQIQAVILVIALVFAILAPIIARLLYFALSRRREYLADATAARLTRYPEGLASALEKLANSDLNLVSANKITAPMYIVNPLKKKGMKLSDLTSTHPPISERIKILRNMAAGAGYLDYQKAFSAIKGKYSKVIPDSALQETGIISIRSASEAKQEEKEKRKKTRDVGDLIRAINKFLFLLCPCGLKIKVHPDYKQPSITCPRCHRELQIPSSGNIQALSGIAEK